MTFLPLKWHDSQASGTIPREPPQLPPLTPRAAHGDAAATAPTSSRSRMILEPRRCHAPCCSGACHAAGWCGCQRLPPPMSWWWWCSASEADSVGRSGKEGRRAPCGDRSGKGRSQTEEHSRASVAEEQGRRELRPRPLPPQRLLVLLRRPRSSSAPPLRAGRADRGRLLFGSIFFLPGRLKSSSAAALHAEERNTASCHPCRGTRP
ncbi:unnamed protein product [Urochloa humidicola]